MTNNAASPPPAPAYTCPLPGLPGALPVATEYQALRAIAQWAMGRAYLPESGPAYRAALIRLAETARDVARYW